MEYSAAAITSYVITEGLTEKLEQPILDIMGSSIDDGRKERIRQERQSIEQTDDPAVLVEIMRKGCDVFNQQLLCTKVLDIHEQTMPLLLRRYRTCALDHFIEAATMALATCERKYVETLREMYGDIRCPYAQACACLVFGMQGMENEIPFLYSEYLRFQNDYPDETFHQHPLWALYILHGKM